MERLEPPPYNYKRYHWEPCTFEEKKSKKQKLFLTKDLLRPIQISVLIDYSLSLFWGTFVAIALFLFRVLGPFNWHVDLLFLIICSNWLQIVPIVTQNNKQKYLAEHNYVFQLSSMAGEQVFL